jgi:hypothetical protein
MHAGHWIRIAHRVSAVLLAAFLAAHLLNHIVALWGIAAHLAFMEGARLVYRSPALEAMLLAAVLVQIVTGVEQVRAGRGTRRGFWQRTQTVSGLYLAFFLANHTFWVLVEGKFDQIDRQIVLEGPLDAAQRQRLLEIADKCPVHRTLTSEIEIRTRLG